LLLDCYISEQSSSTSIAINVATISVQLGSGGILIFFFLFRNGGVWRQAATAAAAAAAAARVCVRVCLRVRVRVRVRVHVRV
jgi:hypothetical protein